MSLLQQKLGHFRQSITPYTAPTSERATGEQKGVPAKALVTATAGTASTHITHGATGASGSSGAASAPLASGGGGGGDGGAGASAATFPVHINAQGRGNRYSGRKGKGGGGAGVGAGGAGGDGGGSAGGDRKSAPDPFQLSDEGLRRIAMSASAYSLYKFVQTLAGSLTELRRKDRKVVSPSVDELWVTEKNDRVRWFVQEKPLGDGVSFEENFDNYVTGRCAQAINSAWTLICYKEPEWKKLGLHYLFTQPELTTMFATLVCMRLQETFDVRSLVSVPTAAIEILSIQDRETLNFFANIEYVRDPSTGRGSWQRRADDDAGSSGGGDSWGGGGGGSGGGSWGGGSSAGSVGSGWGGGDDGSSVRSGGGF